MGRLAFAVFLYAMLAACNSTAPKASSVPISVTWEAPDTCRIGVEGQTYLVGRDDSRLTAALRQARAKSRNAFLQTNDPNVPYKCVGGTIITLQQAGFEHVGFIAEPPPAHR